jgi:hypothetical protein
MPVCIRLLVAVAFEIVTTENKRVLIDPYREGGMRAAVLVPDRIAAGGEKVKC